jgi:hypothetical protein
MTDYLRGKVPGYMPEKEQERERKRRRNEKHFMRVNEKRRASDLVLVRALKVFETAHLHSCALEVTRIPGGWIYRSASAPKATAPLVFVPDTDHGDVSETTNHEPPQDKENN